MIIKDLNGTSYELTKTILSELPKGDQSRYVILKEILQDPPERYTSNFYEHFGVAPVHYRDRNGGLPPSAGEPTYLMNQGCNFIGCRPFSTANHNKILKAAKGAK